MNNFYSFLNTQDILCFSVMGHSVQCMVPINIYSPTKFAVRAISELCSNELINTKIRVSVSNKI